MDVGGGVSIVVICWVFGIDIVIELVKLVEGGNVLDWSKVEVK